MIEAIKFERKLTVEQQDIITDFGAQIEDIKESIQKVKEHQAKVEDNLIKLAILNSKDEPDLQEKIQRNEKWYNTDEELKASLTEELRKHESYLEKAIADYNARSDEDIEAELAADDQRRIRQDYIMEEMDLRLDIESLTDDLEEEEVWGTQNRLNNLLQSQAAGELNLEESIEFLREQIQKKGILREDKQKKLEELQKKYQEHVATPLM